MTVLLIFCLLFAQAALAQSTSCHSARDLVQTVEEYHYAPRPVDDAFSELVYNNFIELLDARGILLTLEDLDQLATEKLKIDEAIMEHRCPLVTQATRIYKKRMHTADSLLQRFKSVSFDFTRADTLKIMWDETRHPTQSQFVQRWRQWVKYQILTAYEQLLSDSVAPDFQHFKERLPDLKAKVIIGESCRLTSEFKSDQKIEQYVQEKYLKSVAHAFDPHTSYFTRSDKKQFDRLISKKAASYGFGLTRNKWGEIEITRIVPGSPAWNSNQLNEGDVIMAVSMPTGRTKDFNCISLKEATRFIRKSNSDEATFYIQKKNGKEIELTLFKEEIDVERNNVKSFILKGEAKKIGYINLPAFYTKRDSPIVLSKGCANDVSTELVKLKREGIEGLIFDVRNNGGGSMKEAIQLAGIFIDWGPLCVLHNKGEEPKTIKDFSRGTIFNEPLVILTNYYSASASELFAAAMQDYNRALVVGTPTYGKSTAQSIVPVRTSKRLLSKGFLKVTNGQFYRVDGTSHQKQGVQPDIQLPHIYDRLEVGERKNASALPATTIDKETYHKPLDSLPVRQLRQKSKQRTSGDSTFISIKEASEALAEKRSYYKLPLSFNAFMKDHMKEDEKVSSEKKHPPDSLQLPLTVKNPSYISGVSSITNENREINSYAIQQIKTDEYIQEAYFIINDLIFLNSK